MADAVFVPAHGRISHQDALLLYTDGMVEEPRRDIDLGIDRMLGEAEHLLRGDLDGAAAPARRRPRLPRRRPRDGRRLAELTQVDAPGAARAWFRGGEAAAGRF